MAVLISFGIFVVLAGLAYVLFFSPRSQVFGLFHYRGTTHEKIIALTFDDGPNPPYTQTILDILARHGVHATFFVVGKNVEQHPEIARNIVAGGHVIGNHSYRHSFWQYLRHPFFASEIKHTQEVIHRITGKTPALFRPPWLFRQPALFRTLRLAGLTPISGVFGSYLEVLQSPAIHLAARAMSHIKPGTILIFHDGYNAQGGNRAETVKAIELLVPKLLAAGYTFVTVDQLLGIPAYQ